MTIILYEDDPAGEKTFYAHVQLDQPGMNGFISMTENPFIEAYMKSI